ncbi:MAG: transposase [Nitrospira sp.]
MFEGGVTYVERVLAPELHKGDVVIWDNLSPHKSVSARAAIEAAGARVERLPVYSPDLSPIEEMFSKIKGKLRSIAARSIEGVMKAMSQTLGEVTSNDILGWFRDRCAYAMQS